MNVTYLFLLLLLCSASVAIFFLTFALRHWQTPGSRYFGIVMIGEAIWATGYFFELLVPNLSAKIILDNLQFIGSDAMTIGVLLFILSYTGRSKIAEKLAQGIWIIPVINLVMVWTEPFHNLVRSSIALIDAYGITHLVYRYGLWMWTYIGYSYLMLLPCIPIMLLYTIHTHRIYQIQAWLVLIGLFSLTMGSMVTAVGIIPIPELSHIDITPIIFSATSPFWAWAIFRERLLDLVPIARDMLIDHMPDGVLVIDKKRRIVDANAGAQILLGITANELIGHPIEFITPALAHTVLPHDDWNSCEELQTNQSSRSAPASIWVDINVNRIYNRRKRMLGWLMILRDCSDRKHAEDELRINQARMQALFDSAGIGIVIGDANGRYQYFNRHVLETTGYTHDELVMLNISEMVHPDDLPQTKSDMQQLFSGTADNYQRERRYRCKDGRFLWVENTVTVIRDSQGQMVSVISILNNVTHRKYMESALRKSEERLRYILDFSPNGVLVLDEDQSIQYANPMAHRLLQKDNLIGDFFALPLINDVPHDQSFEVDVVSQTRRTTLEIRAMTSDWEGKPAYVLSLIDITERKVLEEELRNARLASEAANRTKSLFLANMSHELRTPLNAILGFSQIMARSTEQPEEHRNYLAIIARSGEHLLSLINDVLDMSKIEAGRVTLHKTPFQLWPLLHDVEGLFHFRVQEKGLSLLFFCEPDVPLNLVADEQKLRQVLINLLSNAMKFTNQGRIEVRVGRGKPILCDTLIGDKNDMDDEHPLIIRYETLYIEVSDTGSGIPQNELSQIFEPFTQSKNGLSTKEGTGLGLTISRRFVQMMGGDMGVRSTVGQGTTFFFSVVVGVTDDASIAVKPKEQRVVLSLAPNQKTYRILVVDDQPDNRQLLKDMLLLRGFLVKEAHDGKDALQHWEQWKPHLIWMDMRMPGMSGYDVTRRIKATVQGKQTIIIALTASTFDEQRDEAFAAGCDGFISKPFREQEIFDEMKTHLKLQYIYAEEDESKASLQGARAHARLSSQSLSMLATLPPDTIATLHRAAILGDMYLLNELAEEMPHTLSQEMKQIASTFQYEYLVEVTETLLQP